MLSSCPAPLHPKRESFDPANPPPLNSVRMNLGGEGVSEKGPFSGN